MPIGIDRASRRPLRRGAGATAPLGDVLRLNDIVDAVVAYHPDADVDLIKKAYVYSAKVHAGQVRKTGEPYLIHPLAVSGILAELRLDEDAGCPVVDAGPVDGGPADAGPDGGG